MLELRQVSKRYSGSVAVDNVSFTARAGEITGYLGPNGSGKSTTMKMIAGLIEMTSGEILFNGHPINHDVIAWKQQMGYVSEEPHLDVSPDVLGLRHVPRAPHCRRRSRRTARASGLWPVWDARDHSCRRVLDCQVANGGVHELD